jgi:TetR/AcrR family transcriptional repressor of lmrAB and yxaGH operons
VIATLAARLTEKNIPHTRATQLATHTVISMEGAFIVSRVLRSPEPFNTAIAELTAHAQAAAGAPS